ncbi:MAG: N-acetyltransferase family protein [Tumebacillaceae bacterium]
MEITIEKLTPERVADFLYFFDHVAFADNPRWASCYCYFYYSSSEEEWVNRTAEDNRAAIQEKINASEMHGFLAYANGEPVGWMHANSKAKFVDLPGEQAIGEDKAATVCFIVSPEHRRKGIAGKILAQACESLREAGYETVEGYPVKETDSMTANYHGPLDMYMQAGFEVIEDLGDNRLVVQKRLKS